MSDINIISALQKGIVTEHGGTSATPEAAEGDITTPVEGVALEDILGGYDSKPDWDFAAEQIENDWKFFRREDRPEGPKSTTRQPE